MRVMKFGGGCLENSTDLMRAAALAKGPPTVVVVSALGGITDTLVQILDRTSRRNRFPTILFQRFCRRHLECMPPVASAKDSAERNRHRIETLLNELKQLIRGITCIGEVPPSIQARVLSYGEKLACALMCAALDAQNIPATACDAGRCGITADRPGTNARIDLSRTRRKLRRNLRPLIKSGRLPVVTGFFGLAPDGTTALFGRNASDYTAAAVACALDAEELVIWKGVDGIMTMDPTYGKEARSIDRLTWEEVKELTHFGADILHPLTLDPLENSLTRVRIRNFSKPGLAGTEISAAIKGNGKKICGISCHPGSTMLQLATTPGNLHRLFSRLEEVLRVPSAHITSLVTARDRVTLLMPSADARTLRRALDSNFDPAIRVLNARDDRALVAVVGQALHHPRGLAQLMDALATAGITLEGITPGGATASLCLVIPGNQAGRCLQAIHKRFFPSTIVAPARIANGDQP